MSEQTCGKGLAAHSTLPAKMGELTAAVAQILELHTKALDLSDQHARKEYEVYMRLVEDHRRIAEDLQETARRMAGYHDLPMGRHDDTAMAHPMNRRAFEEFVALESALFALLQTRLDQDRQMLAGMKAE